MTYFPYRITLSGWVLVAVLNTGSLWAEETPTAPAADRVAAVPVGEQAPGSDADLMASSTDLEMSYWGVATKLGLGLGLVVLLAWGAVFLLRKSSIGQQFGGIGKTIRIAERTYLSPKKAIYLVEIGDRTLALGVTEENISTLSEWQAGELELVASPAPGGAFATQFKNLLKQGPQEERSA